MTRPERPLNEQLLGLCLSAFQQPKLLFFQSSGCKGPCFMWQKFYIFLVQFGGTFNILCNKYRLFWPYDLYKTSFRHFFIFFIPLRDHYFITYLKGISILLYACATNSSCRLGSCTVLNVKSCQCKPGACTRPSSKDSWWLLRD